MCPCNLATYFTHLCWDETPKSDKIKLKRELPYNNKECFIINSPDDVEITKAKEKKPLRW